jgi:hypothetical protein
MAEVRVYHPRLYRFLFALLGISAVVISAFGLAQAAPANLIGCVSDWYISDGGTSSFTLVHVDPDDLPLSALRFSRSYNDPTDLLHGYLDFNRDGNSDVFSAVPIGDGNYQWRYSNAATSDWINLAYDPTPPDQLRFGDFNGDGYTDVFSAVPIAGGNYQWRYSSAGTSNWINLAYDSTPPDQLRFGDFNGDGRTDVFALQDIGGGYFSWNVSYSGTTSYQQINSATTLLADMQFGDIDGDGHTDVFTTVPNGQNSDWLYSSAGSGLYQTIVTTNIQNPLLAGDFDGDHRTDFFFTTPLGDGNDQWWYFYYHTTPFAVGSTKLAYDPTPPDQLRFANFDGDGLTDVFTLKQACTLNLPLVVRLGATASFG